MWDLEPSVGSPRCGTWNRRLGVRCLGPSGLATEVTGPAFELIVDTIGREGPLPFDRFLELALYAPEVGFYERGGSAGRAHGDFLTSPEVGPLFGAVIARALDTWWDEAGQPDPWTVVDAGAGPGTLALAVRAAAPRCLPALRYVLVERSSAQRAGHGTHLDLGTTFTSSAEPPDGPFAGVILANELLDNVPFALVERRSSGWSEVRVAIDESDAALVEVMVPAADHLVDVADRVLADAAEGTRLPIQVGAGEWLQTAISRLERGRVVVIDYADTTAGMAARGTDWLRTYRGHERGGSALDEPGSQDITAEVAVDQLALVRAPDEDRSQADFLGAHGLDELVDEGRRIWRERAHLGDLEAIKARSRVTEAEALTDPTGLGAFRVLEWVVT